MFSMDLTITRFYSVYRNLLAISAFQKVFRIIIRIIKQQLTLFNGRLFLKSFCSTYNIWEVILKKTLILNGFSTWKNLISQQMVLHFKFFLFRLYATQNKDFQSLYAGMIFANLKGSLISLHLLKTKVHIRIVYYLFSESSFLNFFPKSLW